MEVAVGAPDGEADGGLVLMEYKIDNRSGKERPEERKRQWGMTLLTH